MGTINLVNSLRYDMHGRKRKTSSLKTKSKRTKYNELIARQQRQYDQVMSEAQKHREKYPSYVSSSNTGAITPKKESMTYSGERQLLGIATMHKSNLVPVFKEDKNYAKDLVRMRRN